ncbi:hypothetical protein VTN31DRAFT_2649 [Thermomyces dupontii]|uniref:uncharacterized protein n=1 Tax=Talaromyces thermophilus TaxID=28565 RepID=UPI0037428B94
MVMEGSWHTLPPVPLSDPHHRAKEAMSTLSCHLEGTGVLSAVNHSWRSFTKEFHRVRIPMTVSGRPL